LKIVDQKSPAEPNRERLREVDEEMVIFDGLDAAIIGFAEVWVGSSRQVIAVYNRALILDILMDRDNMNDEEADEFIDFNITGAYVPGAPAVATLFADEDK
jgi:hypothetical protein